MRGYLLAWGVCGALALGTAQGCSLTESLDGLTGADAGGAGDGVAPEGSAVDARVEAGSDALDAAADGGSPETSLTDRVDETSPDAVEEPATAPIAFVQIAVSTPSGSSGTVHAAFSMAQAAGDLNVVAVGWNDSTSTISGVTDSAGNVYRLAVAPTILGQDLTQAVYYASGIQGAAAGANTVTVTFVQPANVVDLRILEYSGLDPTSPLDAVGSGTGNGAGPASATVTTTTARELVFAAGMSTDTYSGAGAGFSDRIVTSAGDMAEDRVVSTAGAVTAQAPLAASCEWVFQVATFR